MYDNQLGLSLASAGVGASAGQQYAAPVEFVMNGVTYRSENGVFYRKQNGQLIRVRLTDPLEMMAVQSYYENYVQSLAVGLVPGWVNEKINGINYAYYAGERPSNLAAPASNGAPKPETPNSAMSSTTVLIGLGLVLLLLTGGRR